MESPLTLVHQSGAELSLAHLAPMLARRPDTALTRTTRQPGHTNSMPVDTSWTPGDNCSPWTVRVP